MLNEYSLNFFKKIKKKGYFVNFILDLKTHLYEQNKIIEILDGQLLCYNG